MLPSVTFIRLMDSYPELLGGGAFKVIPDAVRYDTETYCGVRIVVACAALWKGLWRDRDCDPRGLQLPVAVAQAQGHPVAVLRRGQRHHVHGRGEGRADDFRVRHAFCACVVLCGEERSQGRSRWLCCRDPGLGAAVLRRAGRRCNPQIMNAVQQEAAVVQLAQQLVAHEVHRPLTTGVDHRVCSLPRRAAHGHL